MRIKKTFYLVGMVTSAVGMMKGSVIGKNVLGNITVTGLKEDFDAPLRRVFQIGGAVTEAPLIGTFISGSDLAGGDYPFVLKNLAVETVMEFDIAHVELSLTVVPWSKIAPIKVRVVLKKWTHRLVLKEVVVEGSAELVQSEVLPDMQKKAMR